MTPKLIRLSDEPKDTDDTEGEPVGWTIVAIGKDGSVLCQAPNGRRARYWFLQEGKK